jgi:hypothetical protein
MFYNSKFNTNVTAEDIKTLVMIVGVHDDRHSGRVLPDTNQESQPLGTKP